MISVKEHNESFVKVFCEDPGIEQELADFFTFMVPNAKFQPAFKAGIWDGKIRLYNVKTKSIYKGLIAVLEKFAASRKYDIIVDESLNNKVDVSRNEVVNFMNALNLHGRGKPIEIREYQYEAVYRMLSTKRNIIIAATSSGKSSMLYATIRYHLLHKRKVLLIVPTVNLVNQMISDFSDYSSANGWNVDSKAHGIYSGQDKVTDKPIIVSTWQSMASLMKNHTKLFKQITDNTDVLICDETHTMKSTVTSKLLEAFTNTEFRTGVSGTLDGTNISELTLTGLLGPVYKAVTAKEMMDKGQVTKLLIKIMVLKHPEYMRKALKGMVYDEEIKHIVSNQARNNFISKLTVACKGNTLILFNYVSHGTILYETIQKLVDVNRKVYFIHGKVDTEERERIRKIVENEQDSIILATASLFSTGTNIPSIENIVFAIPTKSNIRIRQSIGRGLRLKEGKELCKIFDIADDFRVGKVTNATYKHMEDRVAIYTSEQFDYKVLKLDLEY